MNDLDLNRSIERGVHIRSSDDLSILLKTSISKALSLYENGNYLFSNVCLIFPSQSSASRTSSGFLYILEKIGLAVRAELDK